MAESLRQIRNRVRSIENTRKVTNAMEMISAAKLNRIDNILYATRKFFLRSDALLNNLTAGRGLSREPFFEKRVAQKGLALCVITSDNGLCGAYNYNIIRATEEFIAKKGKDKIKLVVIGKKGLVHFRKGGIEIINAYTGLNAKYSDELKGRIKDDLVNIFLGKAADAVYISYTHFETSIRHQPVLERFLNLENRPLPAKDYIIEPDINRVLGELIPKYLSLKLKLILLDAFTSEHAARTIAMQAATINAKELLDGLVLARNKLRQASITQDIMEIVSSAEAQRG